MLRPTVAEYGETEREEAETIPLAMLMLETAALHVEVHGPLPGRAVRNGARGHLTHRSEPATASHNCSIGAEIPVRGAEKQSVR